MQNRSLAFIKLAQPILTPSNTFIKILKRNLGSTGLGLLVVLITQIVLFSILSPYFLTANNFANIGRTVTIVGIASVGATIVMIAGGLGVFEPRKPPISNIEDFEDKGVEYIIKDPEFYKGKRCVIAGGGDSALDWSIYLTERNIASEVVLVHRNSSFRGHLDSVQKVIDLAGEGKIKLITEAEVIGLNGGSQLESVTINQDRKSVV